MDAVRRDVARNRERIEAAARHLVVDGEIPGLNAVARAADVGVATVYRHFATVGELEEALVSEQFDALRVILEDAEPGQLERVLTAHFMLLVEDPLFERVTARPVLASERTARLRDSLIERLEVLLSRARDEGEVRGDVGAGEVLMLLCGIAHATRTSSGSPGSPQESVLLRVVLDGLTPPAGNPPGGARV